MEQFVEECLGSAEALGNAVPFLQDNGSRLKGTKDAFSLVSPTLIPTRTAVVLGSSSDSREIVRIRVHLPTPASYPPITVEFTIPRFPSSKHQQPHRTQFASTDCSCRVTAYPSVGGLVIADPLTTVQLKQLGLSNLEEAARPGPAGSAEEDALALAVMKQGGHWWPSLEFYETHNKYMCQTTVPYDFHFPPVINVAYPSATDQGGENSDSGGGGGVWLLKFSEECWRGLEDTVEPYLPPKPIGWHITQFALTPSDRCRLLARFGAVHYADADDCADIHKTLEEGYRRGKEYEALLTKMSDSDYKRRWRMWLKTGERNKTVLEKLSVDDYKDRWFEWLEASNKTE